jgi:hypothetical protein
MIILRKQCGKGSKAFEINLTTLLKKTFCTKEEPVDDCVAAVVVYPYLNLGLSLRRISLFIVYGWSPILTQKIRHLEKTVPEISEFHSNG